MEKSEELTLNNGFFLHNPIVKKPETQTVVVCGPARGGTTMVAEVLRHLGVPLGTKLTKHTHEDMELFRPLESGDLATFDREVKKRDALHSIWGWKRPQAVYRLNEIYPLLRNPQFIFLFRDPVSVAKRNVITAEADFFNSLVSATQAMQDAGNFIRETSSPCLLVSYEKAIQSPALLVDMVIKFLHLKVSRRLRRNAILSVRPANLAYRKMFSTDQVMGQFDGVFSGRLTGWARNPERLRPVKLELWLDGKFIRNFKANVFRKDLKERGFGKGKHAFVVPVQDLLGGEGPHLIDIRIARSMDSLYGTPYLHDPRRSQRE